MIAEPPSAPRKVVVDDIDKTSCTITWKTPEFDGGSPIAGYYVERKQPFSSIWTKVKRELVAKTRLEVKDLVETNQYEFRVCAENEAGVGKPSESTGIITAKSRFSKPGKPGTPKITDVAQSTITISWEAPTHDGNSSITNYIVEMRSVGDFAWTMANLSEKVSRTHFTIRGIKERVEYEFRVTAENAVGQGPPSDSSQTAKYGQSTYILKVLETCLNAKAVSFAKKCVLPRCHKV